MYAVSMVRKAGVQRYLKFKTFWSLYYLARLTAIQNILKNIAWIFKILVYKWKDTLCF